LSSCVHVQKMFHAMGCAAITTTISMPHATAQTPAAQTCQLGDLKLESSEVIRDIKMTCITFGELNADKSNAILSMHIQQDNRNSQMAWTRPDGAFDTGCIL
jgi:homoserine O-acetyltransferase/O-succinyltransferase